MSLEADLFKLLNNSEYPAALTLLKSNPTLDINALNEKGGSFFMEAVMNESKSPERYAFIELILSNPDFQHSNKPYNDSTATPLKLSAANNEHEIIKIILNQLDLSVHVWLSEYVKEKFSSTTAAFTFADILLGQGWLLDHIKKQTTNPTLTTSTSKQGIFKFFSYQAPETIHNPTGSEHQPKSQIGS